MLAASSLFDVCDINYSHSFRLHLVTFNNRALEVFEGIGVRVREDIRIHLEVIGIWHRGRKCCYGHLVPSFSLLAYCKLICLACVYNDDFQLVLNW